MKMKVSSQDPPKTYLEMHSLANLLEEFKTWSSDCLREKVIERKLLCKNRIMTIYQCQESAEL